MDIEFLFSTFPFISDENMTLSQLYLSDSEYLSPIFKENEINENPDRYIQFASKAFTAKRYIELGYYRKEKPNFLLGTLKIVDVDVDVNSVGVEIIFSQKDLDAAALALIALANFLFNQIEIQRISCKKTAPDKNWTDTMILAGFSKEGQLRKSVLIDETTLADLHIYGLLKQDLPTIDKVQDSVEIFPSSEEILDIVDEINNM